MSQIPFLNELGDALEEAIARQNLRRSEGRRRHFHAPRRALVLVALAIVVLGGGAAAATTLLSAASQKLADGRVNCYFNTAPNSALHDQANSGSGVVSGESPVAMCRQAYRSARHFGEALGAAPDTHGFVACQADATDVDVFVSDGRPGQCERLGEQPLPADYGAATKQLHKLEVELLRIGQHRGCESAQLMARRVRHALMDVGLENWRIRMPPAQPPANWYLGPAGTGGTCASVGDTSWEGPPQKTPGGLDANQELVYIGLGPPQAIATRGYRIIGRLYQQTYDHCYTAASVRALVRRAFTPLGMQARFATAAVQRGTRFEPASERLYERGCVRFNSAYPGNDNRYVDILLIARNAKPLHSDQFYPAANAFKP